MGIFKTIKGAYGAGYRAGMAQPKVVEINGEQKYLRPRCPYPGLLQLVLCFAWLEGEYAGERKRHARERELYYGIIMRRAD